VQGHPSQKPSESQARRATALKSALGPLMELLTDDLVVEVMLSADGAVWVEKVGAGMLRTGVRMATDAPIYPPTPPQGAWGSDCMFVHTPSTEQHGFVRSKLDPLDPRVPIVGDNRPARRGATP
jgi:hypothetical protein